MRATGLRLGLLGACAMIPLIAQAAQLHVGTVKAPAHPFLVPAAEAGKNVVADAVTAWLRSL